MGHTHHFLPNVRFTELRRSEGKSTVRIDRKLLIKGTPKGVSFLCMAFLLLENLMSGDVEDRNARAMTDLLY